MDNMFEAIAILLFILLSASGEIFKRIREATQKKESPKPPEPKPSGQKPAPAKPQSEWYEVPTSKKDKKEDPITTVFKELFDIREQEIVIVDEPPPPPPGERTDRPRKPNIFDQWKEGEKQVVPPFRPEAYPVKPKAQKPVLSKPILQKKPKPVIPPPKSVQKKVEAHGYLIGASAASPEQVFQSLYDRYGSNPLKLAVIYTEILSRPRSLRNSSPRRYT